MHKTIISALRSNTRRQFLKGAGATVAVATIPVTVKAEQTSTNYKLQALLADLETSPGNLIMARVWERQEIAARLRAVICSTEI